MEKSRSSFTGKLGFVLAAAGMILSVISQIGDLIASLLKREYGIKDYGKIFPGHGGVMDRFDSLITVAVFVYAVCVVCAGFGVNLFITW